MSFAKPTNQRRLEVGHRHGVQFDPGLLVLKLLHDSVFKLSIRDCRREANPESHADGVVRDKIVVMTFSFVDGPIRKKVGQGKDNIAVAGFNGEMGVVMLLSCQEKMSQFSNERVLNGDGIVRRLGDNIRAPNGGIGMNIFFPRESNGSKVVG